MDEQSGPAARLYKREMSPSIDYPGRTGARKLKWRGEATDNVLMGLMKRINRSPLTPWLALLLVAVWFVSPAMGMLSCCKPTGQSSCTALEAGGGKSCCEKTQKVVEKPAAKSCCKTPHKDSDKQDSKQDQGKTSGQHSKHSNCQCVSPVGVVGLMLGDTHDPHILASGMPGLESWIDCPHSAWVGSIFHPPLA